MICIEKTIKIHVFHSPAKDKAGFLLFRRKKRANAEGEADRTETFDGSVG
jgi:hypothetical protein